MLVSAVVNTRSSPSSRNQIGATCGRPALRVLANLAVRVPSSRNARVSSRDISCMGAPPPWRRRLVETGGGSGIRTHGGLPHTRFPSVPIRPLSHPSGPWDRTGARFLRSPPPVPFTPHAACRRGATVTPLEPGDPRRLGRWRLVGRLGAGGMGVVYLGR